MHRIETLHHGDNLGDELTLAMAASMASCMVSNCSCRLLPPSCEAVQGSHPHLSYYWAHWHHQFPVNPAKQSSCLVHTGEASSCYAGLEGSVL